MEAFVAASNLLKSPDHLFYTALNRLLAEHGFDALVEKLGAPYYAETMGRPGVPPGVFFRMLFVGYFEGLKSQRAISWRCTDSRSLGEFFGLAPTERSFAQVCNTGGAKRTWFRGLTSVAKRHLMMVAARNLLTIMRAIVGIGGPRSLQGLRALLQIAWTHFGGLISALEQLVTALTGYVAHHSATIGG